MQRHIFLAIILIGLGIFSFNSFKGDYTDYANFEAANSGNKVKIVGQFAKDKPMDYDPENKPNEFGFYMKDNDGATKKVVLSQPKPQDFEMSEQVVVTGVLKDDVFYASEILMKCPSKYKNEEIAIKEKS